MAEGRLQWTRATLPAEYRFGDAREEHTHAPAAFDVIRYEHVCRCGYRLSAIALEAKQEGWKASCR